MMPVGRLVAVTSLLLFGCGGRTTGDPAPGTGSAMPSPAPPAAAPSASPSAPASATPPAPPPSTPSACTLVNYLDRDSFEVAASGIQTCIATPAAASCTRVHTAAEDSLVVADLTEGVGTLRFTYASESSGAHTLLATQLTGTTAGDVVTKASGIPARFTLEEALTDIFSADGMIKEFECSVAR